MACEHGPELSLESVSRGLQQRYFGPAFLGLSLRFDGHSHTGLLGLCYDHLRLVMSVGFGFVGALLGERQGPGHRRLDLAVTADFFLQRFDPLLHLDPLTQALLDRLRDGSDEPIDLGSVVAFERSLELCV